MHFRILSIDGGGIKGVFPAAFLTALEETIGSRVADFFDLVAGTSTGGIIALGLGFGFSANDLLNFYLKEGPNIFPMPNLRSRVRAWTGAAKYNPQPLRHVLEKTFEKRLLGQSRIRLLIPSFDANRGTIHIYKTPHHERLRTDYGCSAVEVALATSAAPIYFPAYRSPSDITLVDGGLWANNPMALAVVEAISMLGCQASDIRVLSIGCTDTPADLVQRGSWLRFWPKRAVDAFLRGQSFGAIGMAQHLAGHANVFRYNPTVVPGAYQLDKVKGLENLRGLGYAEARHALTALMPIFFTMPTTPFTPIYTT